MNGAATSGQLTLTFEPGLVERYRNVRDVVSQGTYQRGLVKTAGQLDMAPGNLSIALSDDTQRKFCVDELERYIQQTGDKTPVYFLVEKYLGDRTATQDQAMGRALEMLGDITQALAAAGVPTRKR